MHLVMLIGTWQGAMCRLAAAAFSQLCGVPMRRSSLAACAGTRDNIGTIREELKDADVADVGFSLRILVPETISILYWMPARTSRTPRCSGLERFHAATSQANVSLKLANATSCSGNLGKATRPSQLLSYTPLTRRPAASYTTWLGVLAASGVFVLGRSFFPTVAGAWGDRSSPDFPNTQEFGKQL